MMARFDVLASTVIVACAFSAAVAIKCVQHKCDGTCPSPLPAATECSGTSLVLCAIFKDFRGRRNMTTFACFPAPKDGEMVKFSKGRLSRELCVDDGCNNVDLFNSPANMQVSNTTTSAPRSKCVRCYRPCPPVLPKPIMCPLGKDYCMKTIYFDDDESEMNECSTKPENEIMNTCKGMKKKKGSCSVYCKEDGCNDLPVNMEPVTESPIKTTSVTKATVKIEPATKATVKIEPATKAPVATKPATDSKTSNMKTPDNNESTSLIPNEQWTVCAAVFTFIISHFN